MNLTNIKYFAFVTFPEERAAAHIGLQVFSARLAGFFKGWGFEPSLTALFHTCEIGFSDAAGCLSHHVKGHLGGDVSTFELSSVSGDISPQKANVAVGEASRKLSFPEDVLPEFLVFAGTATQVSALYSCMMDLYQRFTSLSTDPAGRAFLKHIESCRTAAFSALVFDPVRGGCSLLS